MNFSPSSSSNPNQDEQNPPILSTNYHPSSPNLYHNPNLNPNAPPNPYPNPSCSNINAAWSFTEEKEFERLLVESCGWDESTRWQRIAAQLGGGRTAAEVEEHYQELVHDVELIESGLIPYPSYNDDDSLWRVDDDAFMEDSEEEEDGEKFDKSTLSTPPSGGEQVGRETNKGAKWTDDEHRLFLIGLKKYRKGDWRSISRNLVTTRCPTQVASHAQKFFLRLEAPPKDRKRYSIHDNTNVDSDALADLFRRGLIDASNVDDDSLADLIRQGLVSSGSTSTAAQPSVAATVQPTHYISPDHAEAHLPLDPNTTSNHISMGLQQHGAHISPDHDAAHLQLDANTTSNYIPMGLQQLGTDISPHHAWASMQPSPDISPNHAWTSLQPSPDVSPNHAWTSLQPSPDISPTHAWTSLQSSPDISPPNHVLADQQNPSANTFQPTSCVSSNHIIADEQNPSSSTFQAAAYIFSNEILEIPQSDATIDPRFHLPAEHYDYYKQL